MLPAPPLHHNVNSELTISSVLIVQGTQYTCINNYSVVDIQECEGKAREEAECKRKEGVRDLGASDEG